MDAVTRDRLRALVRRFYRHHGASFDRSRERPWRGWETLLLHLPAERPLRVLDVGCGNGRFARFLRDRDVAARVVGVDADLGLLAAARREAGDALALAALDLADLAALGPRSGTRSSARFDLVVAFGVLHHVPAFAGRVAFLRALAARLAPGGRLVVSSWRFDREPRWQRRLVPWAEGAPDVDPAALEDGDHLLSWQADRNLPRYCHLTGDGERERLLAAVPSVDLVATFAADRGNDYWVLAAAATGTSAAPVR